MQTFKVTDDLVVEALGPDEAEKPLVYIKANNQVVIVFSDEIRHLMSALAEAAGWLAETVCIRENG